MSASKYLKMADFLCVRYVKVALGAIKKKLTMSASNQDGWPNVMLIKSNSLQGMN